jgi:carbonic anhydrase/acetyltransferase-like protein (isoleucine patch superfamily)
MGRVLHARNGVSPQVAPSARVAPGAQLVGNVHVADDCVIDYGVIVTSAGPPVTIGAGSVLMPGCVIRSTGGSHRPAFEVEIGPESLIGPLATLAGCRIGRAVYVATGAMVFHGASVGDGSRLAAGSIVHTGARLPAGSRVGMRQFAIAADSGDATVTSDLDRAREQLARSDFFGRVFDTSEERLEELHRQTVATLRDEAADWDDLAS